MYFLAHSTNPGAVKLVRTMRQYWRWAATSGLVAVLMFLTMKWGPALPGLVEVLVVVVLITTLIGVWIFWAKGQKCYTQVKELVEKREVLKVSMAARREYLALTREANVNPSPDELYVCVKTQQAAMRNKLFELHAYGGRRP